MSEANRLRLDWNLGDEESPELDSYQNNFTDFANFFSDGMYGGGFVHRRIKTREIFDLAESAYLGLRRAVHRAEAATDAAAVAVSADDAGDDGAPPPTPRKQLASGRKSHRSVTWSGVG